MCLPGIDWLTNFLYMYILIDISVDKFELGNEYDYRIATMF